MVRIGLEAGPLSQWLHAALVASGREVVLLETRHVKAALSAMTVKTDRKVGDAMVQTALFEAAHIMLRRASRFSSLKRWALDVGQRRGMKRAKVALARKLGVVLHRRWKDTTDFRWSANAAAA